MPVTPAQQPKPAAATPEHRPTPDPTAIYPTPTAEPSVVPAAAPVAATEEPTVTAQADPRPTDVIRQQLRERVAGRSKLQAKHHVQSLLFGLGFGALTLLVVLFSFFNEVVIAPFIQPSRTVNATPIIMGPDGVAASDKNEVIIPKINVQIPLDFSAKSTDEKEFEAALDRGVAHYPTTALPGQKGNTSFFGHSSNNIFNPGQYKFAFVMLNELVPGDTFYITYNGVAYAYQVYDKKIVEATAVEILNPVPGKESTAMLVTCDPPGTSLRRLAVWGEQVSPNPSANTAAAPAGVQPSQQDSQALPGNGPTLWGRFWNWVSGN
jgi:LPXTG-site transpeptidase (sortase) family protein